MTDATRAIEEVAKVLVRENPRRIAQRTLNHLKEINFAEGAAVFRAPDPGGRLPIYVSAGIEQGGIDLAQRVVTERRAVLDAGARVLERDTGGRSFLVHPLLDGGVLVGLLYLDGQSVAFNTLIDLSGVERFATILVASLTTQETLEMAPYRSQLARTSLSEIRRAHLVAQLEEHEWNKSVVARKMGVTRATIYEWMEKLGIENERKPKGRR